MDNLWNWLVVSTYPSEKYMSLSISMMTFPQLNGKRQVMFQSPPRGNNSQSAEYFGHNGGNDSPMISGKSRESGERTGFGRNMIYPETWGV